MRTRTAAWIPAVIALSLFALAPAKTLAQNQARLGSDVALNGGLPREAQGVTVDQKLGEVIPVGLPLTNSKGELIKTGYVFDGKLPVILTLNYSDCPMLCSVQLNALVKSLGEMDLKIGQDFRMLTVSIDPNESTKTVAETKKKYLDDLKNQAYADKGWVFATAKQPVITKLADVVGFRYRYDASIKQYNHPAMLAFISPDGVITRYSLAIDFPPEQMKLALVEAGNGNVGTAVDQFIMWCYSYDPDSNSYTPAAWKIMRLCGLGFIGLMFAALVPYWVGRKGSSAEEPELDDLESGMKSPVGG
ncbi:MAG: SCO family protein [Planctomycetota bacterium]